MKEDSLNSLWAQILEGSLLSAVISSPRDKRSEISSKLNVRPVEIKGQHSYQITEKRHNKAIHRNMAFQEFSDYIKEIFPRDYRQAMITTQEASYHLLADKHGKVTCLKKDATAPIPIAGHNRSKNYILPEGKAIPFMVELGVMSAQGKVIAKKYDKFRQVNRFLEMVDDIIASLPTDRPIEVVDFGCGKAYLTFALYHYLHELKGLSVRMTGLDLKCEVITNCQALAESVGYSELRFEIGDIQHYQPRGKVDLVITLHACNTATDAALAKAIGWDTEAILCVPCCQHELYEQIQNVELSTLLRHGILRERMAALATDAARAELLTMAGYDVQILEFIDMEHTPKNLLLRAVKGANEARRLAATGRFKRFKESLKFDICLERLLSS